PDEALDPGEVSEVGLEPRQRVQERYARVLASRLQVHVATDLAPVDLTGEPVHGRCTRAVDDVPHLYRCLVGPARRGRDGRQLVSKLRQPSFWVHLHLP